MHVRRDLFRGESVFFFHFPIFPPLIVIQFHMKYNIEDHAKDVSASVTEITIALQWN